MKLFSWNVNGIRAVINKGEFARFISTYDPDIICLQETKASRSQVEIDLSEYTEHFYSAAKKGYCLCPAQLAAASGAVFARSAFCACQPRSRAELAMTKTEPALCTRAPLTGLSRPLMARAMAAKFSSMKKLRLRYIVRKKNFLQII